MTGTEIWVGRRFQDVPIAHLDQQKIELDVWKMNTMVVSEAHKYLIIAVDAVLHVYQFDHELLSSSNKFTTQNSKDQHIFKNIKGAKIFGKPKIIELNNDNQDINNLKLIRCDDREFICTVDYGGNVRMIFLDNLDREHIKFRNVYQGVHDNSTWSLTGATMNPPRVAVGSNAHKVTVFDLQSGKKSQINAHQHNVPCVSFSPCGKFIASTSIDKSIKIWAEVPPEFMDDDDGESE